jgi:hypothetical protein
MLEYWAKRKRVPLEPIPRRDVLQYSITPMISEVHGAGLFAG